MFTRIVSGVNSLSVGARLVFLHIQKLVRQNYHAWQRVSYASMAFKMFSIVVLLAIVPVNTVKAGRQSYKTAVKLDTNSPLAISGIDRQIQITSGESELDAQVRLASQSRRAASGRQIAYSIQRDPTYFKSLYQSAASAYGIPWELLAAVHYVESGASDSTGKSSYAGATGPMQFMPGTWRTWGVDGNGDGSADITNVSDAVYGAANLLAAGGAAEGNVDGALLNYNHAYWYVDKVKDVASSITW